MHRDEALSLKQLLATKPTLELICVSTKNEWTKKANIHIGQVVTLTSLLETGDEDDLMENLDPAFELNGTGYAVSYIDFELWHPGFDIENYKRMTRKKHLM